MTDIFFAMDHILLYADYSDPQIHRHWAKHIFISLDGQMNCIIEGQRVECEGIMLSSNVFHTIESKGKVLVYLFDETTDVAKIMEETYLKNSKYKIINLYKVQKIKRIWDERMSNLNNFKNIRENYLNTHNKVLKTIKLDVTRLYIDDNRIKKALYSLWNRKGIDEGIIEELAKMVFLSQSRFSHLFKEQTNISLNSFLVIIKIVKAYKYIFEGKSITEASIQAGFSSSSHFATTSKSIFGVNASELKKCARITQI